MENGITPAILWAIAGLVLIVAEVLTVTFILLFFGIAALSVALVKFLGLSHLPLEIGLFAIIGLSGILLFRKRIRANFESKKSVAIDLNKKIILSAAVPAKSHARVEYQGSFWTVVNQTEHTFMPGDEARIVRTEGIELHIAPIHHS